MSTKKREPEPPTNQLELLDFLEEEYPLMYATDPPKRKFEAEDRASPAKDKKTRRPAPATNQMELLEFLADTYPLVYADLEAASTKSSGREEEAEPAVGEKRARSL